MPYSCSMSVTNSGLLNFIHVFYFIEMFSLYHQQPWRIAYNSASAEEYNPIFTVNLLNQSPLLNWNYLLHQPCQDASNHWFGLINPLFNLLVWITNAAIKTPILHSSSFLLPPHWMREWIWQGRDSRLESWVTKWRERERIWQGKFY